MKKDFSGKKILEIEKYFCSQGKNYLDKRFEDLLEIKSNLQNVKDLESLEKIQKIGHKIKGSAGLYGFSELSEIGFRLETSAKSGDVANLPIVVDQFQSFLDGANLEKK